jgi:hypothetical protein
MAAAKHGLDRDAIANSDSPSFSGDVSNFLDETERFVAGYEREIEVHQLSQVTVKSFHIGAADAARLYTKPGFLRSDLRPYIRLLFKRLAPGLNHCAGFALGRAQLGSPEQLLRRCPFGVAAVKVTTTG